MAVSLNSSVDLTIKATSYHGLGTYGSMMVGNRALEFYNERNVEDYVQIPWDEIEGIAAEVLFGGRIIPRFVVVTKQSGNFSFSTRDNKKVLRAIREYVPEQNIVRSPSFFDVIRLGVRRIFLILTGRGKE